MHDKDIGQEHQAVYGIIFIGCSNAQRSTGESLASRALLIDPERFRRDFLMLTIYKNIVDNLAKPVYNRQYRKAGLQ